MPKLQISQTKGSGIRHHLTIPSQYIRLLGWRRGQELAVTPSGKNERALEIKEMPKVENQ